MVDGGHEAVEVLLLQAARAGEVFVFAGAEVFLYAEIKITRAFGALVEFFAAKMGVAGVVFVVHVGGVVVEVAGMVGGGAGEQGGVGEGGEAGFAAQVVEVAEGVEAGVRGGVLAGAGVDEFDGFGFEQAGGGKEEQSDQGEPDEQGFEPAAGVCLCHIIRGCRAPRRGWLR